jgi:dolichol-phosphate mannosyltransferase
MTLVNIICSFRNESKNIKQFYNKLNKSFIYYNKKIKPKISKQYKTNKTIEQKLCGEGGRRTNSIDFILYFIDDNSTDNSGEIIRSICRTDKRVKLISFKKNYGGVKTMAYALKIVNSNYCLSFIDCDLEDDPALIPKYLIFIKRHMVINFIRKKRFYKSYFVRIYTNIAYVFLYLISFGKVRIQSGYFKIIGPSVVKKLKKNNQSLQWWHYFPNKYSSSEKNITYTRKVRFKGASHFSFFQLYVWTYYFIGVSYFRNNLYSIYSLLLLFFTIYFFQPFLVAFFLFFLLILIYYFNYYLMSLISIKNQKFKIKQKINL